MKVASEIVEILDCFRRHCERMSLTNRIMGRDKDCEYCPYVDEDGFCSLGDSPNGWNLDHVQKVIEKGL